MAKRRVKKRTHAGAVPAAPGNAPAKPGDRTPKSMVIRVGASEVGPSVTQLVKDVRRMMEPQTASRLKERRSNKLRDYTTMAGPLGVSHLLLFSRSDNGNTNLRLALTPRGPTLHFRVEKYSLCKDVHKSMRRPKSGGSEYLTAPLLVMNNFSTKESKDETAANGGEKLKQIPKHLESLTTTLFQSLFPPINPTTTPLKGIKRVMLLDRLPTTIDSNNNNNPSYTLHLRHYGIETRTAKSVPKPLRKLDAAEKLSHSSTSHNNDTNKRKRNALPNLGKLSDVADYLLDPHAAGGDGFTSASDSEPDTDAEVEILAPATQKVQRRQHARSDKDEVDAPDRRRGVRVERKGVKLHELGPRLKLRLTKVEEGVCAGKVMWHEYMHKTAEEVREMEKVHEARRVERERRRKEQRENVERKRKARGGGKGGNGEEDGEEEEDGEGQDWEDDEWDYEGEEGDVDVDDGDEMEVG